MPHRTDATLALIAETELDVAKELPLITLELSISRARDDQGNTIKNSFTCSTTHNGFNFSCTAGNRKVATRELAKHFESLGFSVVWTAIRDSSKLDDESEAPVVESVYVAHREVPDTSDMVQKLEPGTLQTPADESDEPGEHENPEHGLTMYVPVLDKSGWLTPLSDPTAYRQIYLTAWLMATGVSAYVIDKTMVANRDVQAAIAAVMMTGVAGAECGIPAKAVNPWALGTNGKQEMLWVRVGYKTPDPTTAPFRAGMGPAREAHMTTLSGLPAFPEKAEQWYNRREARKFQGTKRQNTVPARDAYQAKCGQAHACGTAARTSAINNGEDAAEAEIAYKWVYAATMRNLGEIHNEYETQLAKEDVTEEMILSVAAKQKVA